MRYLRNMRYLRVVLRQNIFDNIKVQVVHLTHTHTSICIEKHIKTDIV